MQLAEAVKNFPVKQINTKPTNVSYSFWQLLEHIRITQADIIEFMENPKYKEIQWPNDYWPKPDAMATQSQWKKTIAAIEKYMKTLNAMAGNPHVKLFDKIPHGTGQTYYREFIVVGNHNSYHIGEFAILRQVMKLWP